MKTKIVGILICMLLIATAFFSVSGIENISRMNDKVNQPIDCDCGSMESDTVAATRCGKLVGCGCVYCGTCYSGGACGGDCTMNCDKSAETACASNYANCNSDNCNWHCRCKYKKKVSVWVDCENTLGPWDGSSENPYQFIRLNI